MISTSNILLSAFECNPYMGSDAEVGWQWAHQLTTRNYNVTVITRRTHQAEIERWIAKTGDCQRVKFEYVDIEWLYPVTELVNPRNHIYYYFWQLKAYLQAKQLHNKKPFSLIHHLTWVSFRQPSFMGLVGAPMYFGPVAGGDEIPKGYAKTFAVKQQIVEALRGLVNAFVKLDPLMWLTYAKADKVFFTSPAHLERVPTFVKTKAQIELAIGCDLPKNINYSIDATENSGSIRRHNRLLFVGRFLGLKGLDIGLEAFALIRQVRPDVTLTLVGDGLERERWMRKAKQLNVFDAIEWRGWIPKQEVQKLYTEFDIFYFPSLRDSGGFVILEALQQGMPVVCFKLGGPGTLVDDSCGGAVIAASNIDETILALANTTLKILALLKTDNNLAENCRQRAQLFTWDALIARIYNIEKMEFV
jgi:glycosyltransferase involved in cell wall biosynthesis